MKPAALLLAFASSICGAQGADTVYKSVGPDGKVTYSQTPPATGRLEKKIEYLQLPATTMPDYVLKFRAEMERSITRKQADAGSPSSSELRLFTAKWCGYCRPAKAFLAGRGLAFREIDIETPQGMTEFASAGGNKSVPLLVGPRVRLQGFSADSYAAALGAAPR